MNTAAPIAAILIFYAAQFVGSPTLAAPAITSHHCPKSPEATPNCDNPEIAAMPETLPIPQAKPLAEPLTVLQERARKSKLRYTGIVIDGTRTQVNIENEKGKSRWLIVGEPPSEDDDWFVAEATQYKARFCKHGVERTIDFEPEVIYHYEGSLFLEGYECPPKSTKMAQDKKQESDPDDDDDLRSTRTRDLKFKLHPETGELAVLDKDGGILLSSHRHRELQNEIDTIGKMRRLHSTTDKDFKEAPQRAAEFAKKVVGKDKVSKKELEEVEKDLDHMVDDKDNEQSAHGMILSLDGREEGDSTAHSVVMLHRKKCVQPASSRGRRQLSEEELKQLKTAELYMLTDENGNLAGSSPSVIYVRTPQKIIVLDGFGGVITEVANTYKEPK